MAWPRCTKKIRFPNKNDINGLPACVLRSPVNQKITGTLFHGSGHFSRFESDQGDPTRSYPTYEI